MSYSEVYFGMMKIKELVEKKSYEKIKDFFCLFLLLFCQPEKSSQSNILTSQLKKLALNVGNHAYFFLPAFRMRI